MRQKRAKSYKKQMNVYVHAFKFREPFQVIVDDEIVLASEKSSFNLKKALERTIQGEVKPMITQCCMQSLYNTKNQLAIDMAKTFERRRCNHPPSDPLPPLDCIKSIVLPNNKFKYVLATQKFEFRKVIRNIPGVPLVFMKNSVMIMDSISKATQRYADGLESAKLSEGLNDVKVGFKNDDDEADANDVGDKNVQPAPSKKRKGPKGPNPLSVKKKKLDVNDNSNPTKDKKTRRKRKHKRSGGDGGDGENDGGDGENDDGHGENDDDDDQVSYSE